MGFLQDGLQSWLGLIAWILAESLIHGASVIGSITTWINHFCGRSAELLSSPAFFDIQLAWAVMVLTRISTSGVLTFS